MSSSRQGFLTVTYNDPAKDIFVMLKATLLPPDLRKEDRAGLLLDVKTHLIEAERILRISQAIIFRHGLKFCYIINV